MAPSSEEVQLATCVMTYMVQIAEQESSRCDKKIAESSELKKFLLYLSKRAPSAMHGLLNMASQECERSLRDERDVRIARKRSEPPNGSETNAKRLKVTRPTEDETSASQQVAEADLLAQGYTDALQPHANAVPACDNEFHIKQESEQEPYDWTNMSSDTLVISDGDEDDEINGELVPQNSHKVPNTWTGPFSSGTSDRALSTGNDIAEQEKPQKARIDAQENAFEQIRSTSSSIGDETTTSRSDSQISLPQTPSSEKDEQSEIEDSQGSEISLPQTPASEKDRQSEIEDSEEEDLNTEHTRSGLLSVTTPSVRGSQDRERVVLPTPYQVEFGLPMKTPTIEAYVKAHCLTLKSSRTRPQSNIQDEIAKILNTSRLLDFYKARRELYQYLENRVIVPGKKLQAHTTWNMSNPGEILDTLQTVRKNTFDAKIHRAYGQTMLFSSINSQVNEGNKSIVTGQMLGHRAILEKLAREKAGSVSKLEKDRMIASYLSEYYAGKKWLGVIDWFGGSGIVLIFVTAGIGSHYVEHGWTEFQRDCLEYVAGFLHSIKRLVETLGSDALEIYCRNGCLENDCIGRVKLAKFITPDGDGYGDGDEGLEGAEDEESENEWD